MNLTVEDIVLWVLSIILALFVGGYLKSYMGKKGENLATREDIAELTRIAKEVEARVSNDVWARQRDWTMKKEAIFGLVEAIGDLESTSTFVVALALDYPDNQERRSEYSEKFGGALTAFGTAELIMFFVCQGTPVKDLMKEVGAAAVDFLSITREWRPESHQPLIDRFHGTVDRLKAELRIELLAD